MNSDADSGPVGGLKKREYGKTTRSFIVQSSVGIGHDNPEGF